MANDKLVIGVFEDYEQAGKVIEDLRGADFRAEHISMVVPDPENLRMAAVDVVRPGVDRVVLAGSLLGAAGGWLVGLAALAIPGVGPFMAAGPLLSAISGAAAGSLLGGWAGALIHFDVPEYEAKIYEGHLTAGKVLVAVHTHDRAERVRAEDIMEQHNAIEIDTKPEALGALPGPGTPPNVYPNPNPNQQI